MLLPILVNEDISVFSKYIGAPSTVVTFAAMGLSSAEVPRTEYHKLINLINLDNKIEDSFNIITVVDKKRHYYIDGSMKLICDTVNSFLIQTNITRSITLGLSMGGFAAVVYAKRLKNCNTAIGFGAHSSLHPDVVPFDDRSLAIREQIKTWDVIDATHEIDKNIKYHLLYGADDPHDELHAMRYHRMNLDNVSVAFVPESDHNVVESLIKRHVFESYMKFFLSEIK